VYAKRKADWDGLRAYTQSFARVLPDGSNRIPIHFLGLWDTVKAAGTLWRPLTWPYTRHLLGVQTARHAMSIDEKRRPFAAYPVEVDPAHPLDLDQVWFAGVHSDVGGMFATGSRLSDIPLKWMVQDAARGGLITVAASYRTAMSQVTEDCATGPIHQNDAIWACSDPRGEPYRPRPGCTPACGTGSPRILAIATTFPTPSPLWIRTGSPQIEAPSNRQST
jgi:uncharacterized protein (DUF2235 family)